MMLSVSPSAIQSLFGSLFSLVKGSTAMESIAAVADLLERQYATAATIPAKTTNAPMIPTTALFRLIVLTTYSALDSRFPNEGGEVTVLFPLRLRIVSAVLEILRLGVAIDSIPEAFSSSRSSLISIATSLIVW